MTVETETQAEFATVILTIDHSTAPRKNGHLIQKFVTSTEDLVTSMFSLLEYYEETHLIQPATIRQFNLADQSEFPAFVYRTRENIQVVMNADTFVMLAGTKDGSILSATQMILDEVGRAITDADQEAGGVVPIILFSFHTGETLKPEADREG